MKQLTIIFAAVLIMLGGCASHKKIREVATEERTIAVTTVAEKSSAEISVDSFVKKDILDNFDLTFEFTRLDFSEAIIPKDSARIYPAYDSGVVYDTPERINNTAFTPGMPSITKGRLIMASRHCDKSITRDKEEIKAENETEMAEIEESEIKSDESVSESRLPLWQQIILLTTIPLILLAILRVMPRQKR